MRLITIPVSHYCDKARWALDRAGLEYLEEQHLQMLHRPYVRLAGGRRTTPVLVTGDDVLAESHDILVWVDEKLPEPAKLYPADCRDEVLALEQRFDEPYGVETRKLFYEQINSAPREFVLRANNHDAPGWEKALFSLVLPLAKGFVMKYLDITPETLAVARATVDETLDDVAHRLRDGRPFLCGDRFTAADLAFAALSSPLAAPPEYGVRIPDRAEFPERTQRFLEGFDDHPAIAFARRMYSTERRRSART